MHNFVEATPEQFLLSALACAALAFTILVASGIYFVRKSAARQPHLVSVEPSADAKDHVAVICSARIGGLETALVKHIRRLLLLRGFAEVRSASPHEAYGACRGAHLVIDVATENPDSTAADSTNAVLHACAAHGVRGVVQCTDALVGYDASVDVCDGDELSDPGISLISPEPRPAPPTSERLADLFQAEETLARHAAATSSSPPFGAYVLRLHRVVSDELDFPAALPLVLAAGVGALCGGARAQTNLLHVEDAALGVTLAADKLLGGLAGVETVVLTDPAVWTVAHLLHCLASVLRLPAPLLPLLLAPARLLAAIASGAGMPAAADSLRVAETHCYYTGLKANTQLSFTPRASSAGVHAVMRAIASRCLLALRFVAPLLSLTLFLVADALNQIEVATVALAVTMAALAFALSRPPATLPAQPPIAPPLVAGGVPLLGHLLTFIKGPVGMIDDLRSSYRSMFTIRVGPQRITFMIGAGPQVQFIKAKDELLDQAPVYKFTVPVFGEGIVYDSPLDERQQQVKLLVHSMNTKGLEAMVPKMIEEAEEYFRDWGNEGTVELRKVFSELIIMTASSCLMGPEIRENLSAEISRIYHSLDGGLTPLSTLWPSAPTQKHRERDAARKEMVAIFSRIIAGRRSGEVNHDDFLQKIIEFQYRDETDPRTGKVIKTGRPFSDAEVTGLLIVLLFAGQHTSSITSTWLGAMLLDNADAMEEVKKEQEKMCPDAASLNYHNLLEMDAMRRAITETLRLYPPLILLMRQVMKDDFKVGQHTIPKGDVVGLCAPASNLDPRYWSDVTTFKPSRYLPGEDAAEMFDSRSVGHGLMQGFMLSFGGGAHMCSGRRFGYLQVSTIWTILLRDFDMEMITPVPKPAYNDMVVGPDAPIMMRYRRKLPLSEAELARSKLSASKAAAAEPAAAAVNGAKRAAASGGVSLSAPINADFPNGKLIILWGSQTGTAEAFGNQLMREALQRGFDARSIDLEEYPAEKLSDEDEAPVIFLMSTHGEGEPTDNAVTFYRFFEDERCDNLKSLKFTVFALGNKQYEHFCEMGKWIDAKASSLGATRLYELGLGDDDKDLESDFEKWKEGLWTALSPDSATGQAPTQLAAPKAQFECEWLDASSPASTALAFHSSMQPKHQVFECEVGVNRELAQQPQLGSVKHIEIKCASVSGTKALLAYNTADDLAVCCDNGLPLASRVAKRLGMDLAQRFALQPLAAASGRAPPVPTPCSVEQALRFFADLRAPVSKEMLLLLAEACGAPDEAEWLRSLAMPESKQRYHDYVQRDGRGLAELLEESPSCQPAWASLLELAPKLTPRFYTISSSPAHDPKSVHLSVKVLREPMRGAEGRIKEGVCSTQLGALTPGSLACVFVRSSGFRLPSDKAVPVIMVGPGTGIAPFRAFLQEMSASSKRRSGHVRLYFGCRRSNEDYLYKEELESYLKKGALSSLRLAFSREGSQKVYVQHKLQEDGQDIWSMLEKGGYMYICGGTSMGRDVVGAMQEAISTYGKMSREAAAEYIKGMQAKGRLTQELWS